MKTIQLSSAEKAVFQQLDTQQKNIQQHLESTTQSIFESRRLDFSKVGAKVTLAENFDFIFYEEKKDSSAESEAVQENKKSKGKS